ncbi:MAG: Arc family DNA-binding protein [Anaerolineae bacterium]|jgi:hypothetical protein|nr:Arc family DNA-binding protein [Anaerolineae bacterium]
MSQDDRFEARIAFRLPQAMHDRLNEWAREEDRSIANLVYTLVKQAVERRLQQPTQVQVRGDYERN